MTERTRISVHRSTHRELREGKRDGESWDGYLLRLKDGEEPDLAPLLERIEATQEIAREARDAAQRAQERIEEVSES